MSPSEVALWQWLRSQPDGLKFRHQHPAGPYVLDFYCSNHDQWLQAQGIGVLRIKASDMLNDLDNCPTCSGLVHLPSTSLRLVPLPIL